MRFWILLLLACSIAVSSAASEKDDLLRSLDKTIADRGIYQQKKEARIDSLKAVLSSTYDARKKFDIFDKLYSEYLTFNFDSTMSYVDKADKLAEELGESDRKERVSIHKALSLATSGHFSEAVGILSAMKSSAMKPQTRTEYFSACEWTYGVWAEYSHDKVFAPEYKKRSVLYLDSLLSIIPQRTPEYDYRVAEKALRTADFSTAEKMYLKAIGQIPADTRLYAQAAYALALTYKETGRNEKYREWLIKAAISDQITPLKENLALQQLAMFMKSNGEDVAKANRYLRTSLDDAIFYNNRLRMLEIAEKFPEIAIEYQDEIDAQNRYLKISLLIIIFLLAGMSVAVWQLVRQIKKRKLAIDAKQCLADQLKVMNEKLRATNRSREQYTSLFMDLCGAYIEKLNGFPMVLKIKVKKLSDLNSVADRYVRPSEAEVREMFFNFDTAFLKLYPDFISEFNSLLRPDCRIYPKGKELLNTDLRIYSLVRMGIADSNRIASLLFYSPQTIFNHRTSVRNRAINRDTFEHDVMQICKI